MLKSLYAVQECSVLAVGIVTLTGGPWRPRPFACAGTFNMGNVNGYL